MKISLAILAMSIRLAAADTPPPDAANKDAAVKLVAEGSASYDKKDYDAALVKYREAYRIYPSPKLHFNLGLALSGLGRDAEAADELDRFLAEAADAPADARQTARKLLATHDKKIGKLDIVAPVAASVLIDGVSRGTTPLVARVPAGSHAVRVTAAGRVPWEQSIDVKAGSSTRLVPALPVVDLRPKTVTDRDPPSAPPAPERRAEGSVFGTWWLWTIVGVVVIGGAAATYAATRPADAPDTELGTVPL